MVDICPTWQEKRDNADVGNDVLWRMEVAATGWYGFMMHRFDVLMERTGRIYM